MQTSVSRPDSIGNFYFDNPELGTADPVEIHRELTKIIAPSAVLRQLILETEVLPHYVAVAVEYRLSELTREGEFTTPQITAAIIEMRRRVHVTINV